MKRERADKIIRSFAAIQRELRDVADEAGRSAPPDWESFHAACNVSTAVQALKDAVNSRREGTLSEELGG